MYLNKRAEMYVNVVRYYLCPYRGHLRINHLRKLVGGFFVCARRLHALLRRGILLIFRSLSYVQIRHV
jgi:hypothetical protein